ncbi:hypothetical protein G9A89_002713 [Geosiphon pyriformis]|nr:hypothetical protein G9A89_002713 [Geosiphon pyriformis]
MTKAKNKKAASDICSKISNKISTRKAFSVVKAIRQNVLEVFFLPSNHDKLSLVITEATFSSLAGFSPVKVPLKRHTWVSSSVVSTPIKSLKVFNNRPINKLVFLSIDSTLGAANQKFRKVGASLASAIVTPNPFMVPNKILDEISIASFSMSSKMGQDQPLAVLPNVVSSSRSLPVLEAKQSPLVGLPVLENWADQMETESSFSLVSGATSGNAWKTIASYQKFAGWVASTLVLGATFKIKLAHIKAVFQSLHGFLGAKSVSKDNVKLFCVEFVSQISLDTAFLVELTSFVCLVTLKIVKSLVFSESGSFSAAVVLRNVPLDVFAVNIKTALSVFGMVTRVVLKPASIWQYVVVYFEKLDFAMSALNYWSVLVNKDCVRIFLLVNQNETILSCDMFKTKLVNFSPGCTVFKISNMIFQIGGQSCFISQSSDSGHCLCFVLVIFGFQADLNLVRCFQYQETSHLAVDCKVTLSPFLKAPKIFKPHFVGFLSYAKASAFPVMSEFPSLVASVPSVTVVDLAVWSRLNSLEKQISDLAALVKSIVEPVGFLVVLVFRFFDDNTVKTVQLKKDLLFIKYASNNFANLLIGVSKDIACLRSEVDFSGMDYDDMQAAKPSLLSEDTVERVIALWQMLGAEIRSSVKSTRLFLSEFIFDSKNLNGVIEKICGLGLFSPLIVSV